MLSGIVGRRANTDTDHAVIYERIHQLMKRAADLRKQDILLLKSRKIDEVTG